MKRLALALLFLFVNVVLLSAQNSPLPFGDGETLEMIIHYKCAFNADIGTVRFDMKGHDLRTGSPYYHLTANATSYPFFDSFFKVCDFYESKFYADSMKPIYFHRDVKEGKYWAKNVYIWSDGYKEMRAIIDKSTRPHRDTIIKGDDIIRDMLNALFAVRTIDFSALKSGRIFYYTACIDRDVLVLSVKFVKEEEKKIKGVGTFRTYKIAIGVMPRDKNNVSKDDERRSEFSINADDADMSAGTPTSGSGSVFYGKEKIFLWLSADDNRIPIFFSSPVSIGSMNARISSYCNLKYPLTSLTTKQTN